MLHGRNQNVRFQGRDYHVQTEDSDAPACVVTTKVYVGGTIIASTRTDYRALAPDDGQLAYVRRIMEEQHDLMVRNLRSGLYVGEDRIVRRPYVARLAESVPADDPDEALTASVCDGL